MARSESRLFRDLHLILSNQKGNLDLSEGGESDNADVGNDDGGSNDDAGGEDLSTEGLLASIDLEANQDNESESKNDEITDGEKPDASENDGDDLEAQLEALKLEDNPEAKGLLDELNKLGILNKGLPVEFDDIEKAKELLSKGFDYTQKTQELAESRKTFDAELAQEKEAFATEREAFQTEIAQHEKSLTNYGIFQDTLAEIQNKDPDLFEEINQYYLGHEASHQKSSNNPEVAALKKQIKELSEKVNGSQESEDQKQLGEIKANWEKEIGNVQTSFGPKLRSLGIKADWAKVQEIWKADTTNTMTVKAALFAEYGEQISKSMANKAKLAETRAKVARTTAKPDNNQDSEIFGMTSGNSYENEAFEILKDL